MPWWIGRSTTPALMPGGSPSSPKGWRRCRPDDRDRIMALFENLVQDGRLGEEARLVLWERLHELPARHERFTSSPRALSPSLQTRLSDLTARLEPTSDPQRFAYLFDWHPDLPGVDNSDFEAHAARLSQLRSEALLFVLAMPDRVKGLTDLARRVAAPTQLGWALGDLDEVELPELRSWFSSSEPNLRGSSCDLGPSSDGDSRFRVVCTSTSRARPRG